MNGATPVTSPIRMSTPRMSSVATNGMSQKRFRRHKKANSSLTVPAPLAIFLRAFRAICRIIA
jgi:hypothetical protein